MKLCIKEITPCTNVTHWALMVVDHTEIWTEIVELDSRSVRGFQLKEPLFQDLLSLCGLAKQFSQDFWTYRDGKAMAFPWDYGEQDARHIALALQHHRIVAGERSPTTMLGQGTGTGEA